MFQYYISVTNFFLSQICTGMIKYHTLKYVRMIQIITCVWYVSSNLELCFMVMYGVMQLMTYCIDSCCVVCSYYRTAVDDSLPADCGWESTRVVTRRTTHRYTSCTPSVRQKTFALFNLPVVSIRSWKLNAFENTWKVLEL